MIDDRHELELGRAARKAEIEKKSENTKALEDLVKEKMKGGEG